MVISEWPSMWIQHWWTSLLYANGNCNRFTSEGKSSHMEDSRWWPNGHWIEMIIQKAETTTTTARNDDNNVSKRCSIREAGNSACDIESLSQWIGRRVTLTRESHNRWKGECSEKFQRCVVDVFVVVHRRYSGTARRALSGSLQTEAECRTRKRQRVSKRLTHYGVLVQSPIKSWKSLIK